MAQEESKKKKVDAIPIEYQVNIPGLGDEAQIVYGPTGGCPVDHVCVRTISSYINAFYKWSASAAIIMAIIIIMIGGIEYMIGSAVGTIEKAKDHIKNGVIGLLLVFSTSAVLSFVNPNITQISAMELPAIETVFVTSENTDQDNADPDPGNPGQVGLPPVTTSSNPQKLALQPSGSNVTVPSARPAKQVPVNEVVTAPTVPYYNQRSYSDVYGGCGTIKSSGCGPTSAAMVLSYLEVNADPPKVASAFAADGFRACPKDDEGKPICDKCNGTNWGAFTSSSIVTDNNLVGRQIQAINRKEILSLLSAGKPLIASMGCSRFTRYGHFVVLTGMNADGTIAVNDPNSTSRNQTTASELWEEVYVTADGKRDCTQRGNRAALKSVWLIESKDATSRNTELDEEDIWPNDHLQLASSFLLDSVKNFVPKPL
ncbi:hypothetical protein HOI83_04610 [Candidatus Uhrbacteria bacterium]|nr:hypothetical protein [Candidatus Uhrbacteria bacterium]